MVSINILHPIIYIFYVAINVGPDNICASYWVPTSLPLGEYHLRVNSTVNTTIQSNTTIQQLTARGASFNLTTSAPLGCGQNKGVGTFTTIPSPSASSFTSLFLEQPWAGQNVVFDPSAGSVYEQLTIGWSYKDGKNALGNGISNIVAQVLDTSGNAVGSSQSFKTPESSDGGGQIDMSQIGLQQNGTYKLRIQYTNVFTDGTVGAGGQVTLTSNTFNLVNLITNCTALAVAANSSSGSSGSQGGGNGSSGSGGPGSGGSGSGAAAVEVKGVISATFSLLVVAMVA